MLSLITCTMSHYIKFRTLNPLVPSITHSHIACFGDKFIGLFLLLFFCCLLLLLLLVSLFLLASSLSFVLKLLRTPMNSRALSKSWNSRPLSLSFGLKLSCTLIDSHATSKSLNSRLLSHYPGCQRFVLRGFRSRSKCLYCDPREKSLEQSAVSLIAPSQWEAC